jgi:rhodanese-related sulfurtransferase
MAKRENSWRFGAAMALAALLAGGCSGITDADIKQVDVDEVRTLTLRQAERPDTRLLILIDPRAKARYDAGRLPSARNLKLPQVPERSGTDPQIAAHRHIIVYGTDPGNAAARAMTKRMMSVGYDGVRLFAGGVREWEAMGYPVEVTPQPPAPPEPAPLEAAEGQAPTDDPNP